MSIIASKAKGLFFNSQKCPQLAEWSSRAPRGSARKAVATAVAMSAATLLFSNVAQADVAWAPGGTLGGNGAWDTTTSNWTSGSTPTTYDGTGAIFGGLTNNYNVSVNVPITVSTGLTFNANGVSLVSSNASTQLISLSGTNPFVIVNGTSFNSSGYLTGTNISFGTYATVGNSFNGSTPVGTSSTTGVATFPGVSLAGSKGFNLSGGGELILASPLATTGLINVGTGSTLTVGNRLVTAGTADLPTLLLNGDSVTLNNSTLQFSTSASVTSAATAVSLGTLTVNGNSAVSVFRDATGTNSASVLTTSGSQLVLQSGSNLNFYEAGTLVGPFAYVSFGSTVINGPTTINATQNSLGTKVENPRLGIFNDNGNAVTFLSGGNSTLQGGQIQIQSTSGAPASATGPWTLGNPASGGTQGVILDMNTTSGSTGGMTNNAITVNNYSALYFDGAGALSWGNSSQNINISGPGVAMVGNSALHLLTLNNSSSNGSNGTGGAIEFGSTTLSTTGTSNYLESQVVMLSSSYIGSNNNNTSQIDGSITQNVSGLSLTKWSTGNGTLILNGTGNNWTGGTFIDGGTLNISSNSSLGTYSTTDKGPLTLVVPNSTTSSALILNNATQKVGSLSSIFNASAGTVSNNITLTGTALTIVQTTAGTFGPGPSPVTMTSTIAGTGSVTLGAGSTAALTFSGPNNYSGGTTVNAGALLVTNTTGSATGTGPLLISNANFGGTGTIAGATTALNSAITIGSTLGGSGHLPGTLTLSGGLNLSGGSVSYFLNTPNSSDLIALGSSALTLTGSTVINLANLGALDSGTYPLITYSDATAPSTSGLSFGSTSAGFGYAFASTPTELDVVVTAPSPIIWNVSGNGNWDTATPNFNNTSGTAVAFNNTGAVRFDDASGGTASVVTLSTALTPSLVTFGNNTKSYTLTGAGNISGNTSVIVAGTGTVTLATTSGNTFTGSVAVDAGGTLIVTSDAQLGNAANSISLTSNASFTNLSTLEFNNSSNSSSARTITVFGTGGAIDVPAGQVTTLTGAIVGSGGLAKTDTGTLVLSNASNGYVGTTNVSAGTLRLGANNALPSFSQLQIGPSGTFNLSGFNASVGSLSGSGSIIFGATAATLTTGSSNFNTSFSGPITGLGTLVQAGSGILTLSGANNFSGGLMVSAGGIVVGSQTSLGSLTTGNFNISSGGTLQLTSNYNASAKSVAVGTGGGSFNTAGFNLTLNTLTGVSTGGAVLTIYGGNSTVNFAGVSNVASGGISLGRQNDSGGNILVITAADTLGNTGLGADTATAFSNFVTINAPGFNSATGLINPANSLVLGSGNTGVQMGFNTTAGALALTGSAIGQPALSTTSGTSFPAGLIFYNGTSLIGHGLSGYNGGNLTIADGATVTFNAPLATDRLIEDVSVRNNNDANTTNSVNVTGSGTVQITSGAVSLSSNSAFNGTWNVAMGASGNVGTGVTYTTGSNGVFLVAPITGAFGEPLNALGFATGQATGAGAPVNLYSGAIAFGADKAQSGGGLTVKSYRSPLNLYGGAIASSGFDYLSAGYNTSYAQIGTSLSNAPYVIANLAGNINFEPGSVVNLLTYDPVTPSTGGRSLNFINDGTAAAGLTGGLTWGANAQVIINAGNTSGGAVSFARTTGTVSVDTGAVLNISSGATVNIGFLPGSTGPTGLDPLTDPLYGSTVAVLDSGKIVWGGRTGLTGDTGIKTYAATGLTMTANASAGLAAADVTADRTVLNLGSLTLAGNTTTGFTSKLDLANNDLIVQNANAATLALITAEVKQGFNNGNGLGTNGIVSTTAVGNTTHLTALGVILNDDGTGSGTPLYTSFDNVSENNPDTDLLIKYTYFGDADLNGKVDATDYSRIDNGFLTHATGWFNGDFNYDGVINGSDYTLIDNAFNTQGAQLAASIAGPSAVTTAQIAGPVGTAAVPEPASLGILGLGSLALLGRRRRALN